MNMLLCKKSLREKEKCVCPFCRKSLTEEKASRKKAICRIRCLCGNKSSGEERMGKEGKCAMNGFCCNKSPKEEEPSTKGQKCGLGYLCCNKSSIEERSTKMKENSEQISRRSGWWPCFFCGAKSSEGSEGRGCLNCCRSSMQEESTGKRERVTCCYRNRPTKNCSSPKGGCAEFMGCLCCSKSARKKKGKSSRRLCWKRKEKQKSNHLASLVKTISFKSDSAGKDRSAVEEILRIGNGNIAARVFTYNQLAAATREFNSECLLGTGGFGRVYKGQLEDTKELVAVKQLDRQGYQGNREFLIEVLMLSLLNHQNLVNLLGYCADGDERILVYDYMPLGSLQDHLHDLTPDKKPLDWSTRMKIALGAAKGLEYMHDTANPPVIYRDLKASNILLDKDFTSKLSDFGLAKLGPVGEKKHISTRVMGTYGYCAPEYARTGKLTKMSDVYSFGVMLLELITGRKPVDKTRPAKEQVLIEWARPLFKHKKKFVEMADPLLEGKFPVKILYQAIAIASLCLQENATTRPVVRDIVIALEFLNGQDCDGRPGEPEGSLPQPKPEIQRSTSGTNDEDWQSCSTVSQEEFKEDIDIA